MRVRAEGETLSVIVEQGEDGLAHLVWFGPKCEEALAQHAGFQRLPASPDIPIGPTLLPEHGRGFHGIPQVEGWCIQSGRRLKLAAPQIAQEHGKIVLRAIDPVLGIEVKSRLAFDGDALTIACSLDHKGPTPVSIERVASALLPSPDWAVEAFTSAGAWGREGTPAARDWSAGRIEQVGRSGRPGFDGGPTLSVKDTGSYEQTGRWMTLHLAWSGPFRLAAERATDGSGQLLAERLFAPGELRLTPGDRIDLPTALVALSGSGSNGVSSIFRNSIRRAGRRLRRPVHFNTWEARYFDVTEAGCIALAKKAAEIGAERFVLDDGWFKGRRNDQTSLGDWTVDANQFPNGLTPLIEAVHAEGMEFGLWVEPEMVSPDSDLYRAHPDWVLGWPETDLATGRHQLVLDLALEEVRDHLLTTLSALLDSYPITYLKWDCNRDLYPASREGIANPGAQTDGLYELLDRLREAHTVEIESCASGGGRIDAGIAARTDRFWTSDATDAIDRLQIQRSAALIMPHERLGAHIGPSPNPMTGRKIPMTFRILAAFFGHMGIEADPDHLTDAERMALKRGIDLYKTHRDWMHDGQLLHASPAEADPHVDLIVSAGGTQAMLRIMRINTPMRPTQARIRLIGLDPASHYRLTEIALDGDPMLWPIGEFEGAGLMNQGLSLDPGRSQTGRLIHIERIG